MSEAPLMESSRLTLWAADVHGLQAGRPLLPPNWDVFCTTEAEVAYPGSSHYGLVVVLPEPGDLPSRPNLRAMLHRWSAASLPVVIQASASHDTAWLEDIPGWTPCRDVGDLASLVASGRVRTALRQLELLVTAHRRARIVLRRTLAATVELPVAQPSTSQIAARIGMHRSSIAREWQIAKAEGLMLPPSFEDLLGWRLLLCAAAFYRGDRKRSWLLAELGVSSARLARQAHRLAGLSLAELFWHSRALAFRLFDQRVVEVLRASLPLPIADDTY